MGTEVGLATVTAATLIAQTASSMQIRAFELRMVVMTSVARERKRPEVILLDRRPRWMYWSRLAVSTIPLNSVPG